MGLDKNNIPDEYLCEVCKPRPIDRKRAKNLQARRRTEIFNNSSSSDDGDKQRLNKQRMLNKKQPLKPAGTTLLNHANKKMLDRKAGNLVNANKRQPKKGASLLEKAKKQYKKRKSAEMAASAAASALKNKTVSPKKSAIARRKSQLNDSDLDSDAENVNNEDDELEPEVEHGQNLRSWIDQYEEAVTNHYSPELRARLARAGPNGITADLRASAIGGPTRCNVSLKGNGVKILTAAMDLKNNTPIIECRGKIMLASQYRSGANKLKQDCPYVFFYTIGDNLQICLDGKTYGNDGRFCRRSATSYNAEIRHVIDKGSLHLFIVAMKTIDKNQEILLRSADKEMNHISALPSINADLKEISKKPPAAASAASALMNGLVNSLSSPEEAPLRDSIKKKKKMKKVKVVLKPQTDKKLKSNARKPKVKAEVKSEPSSNPVKVEVKPEPAQAPISTPSIVKQEIKKEFKKESASSEDEQHSDDMDQGPLSPQNAKNGPVGSPVKGSPSKLGLPDASGLIVGVNTINYDASSSVKNKAKSREERKMEMIMKAIEAMERAEQRKKDTGEQGGTSGPPSSKRRRSSSSYRNNADSNLDASSADESMKPEPSKRTRKKQTKGSKTPATSAGNGLTTAQRRRSRVMSGGSVSNMSADEAVNSSTPAESASNANGPFRFPKTKKSMMSDWLQESESNSIADDDDVSANYLKGSRSPPGIATHLLRSSSAQSPVKNVCSAKKRWLRQAISEDHTEDSMVNGGSPSSASNEAHQVHVQAQADMVTPLKKRRLANYKEDNMNNPEELAKVPINGLKKQILQNLVLEAVLDKAMEDMLATPPNPNKDDKDKDIVKEEIAPSSENSKEISKVVPEPNSAFKSFFNSSVSLEALEAEIAASKKQRETLGVNASEANDKLEQHSSPLLEPQPEPVKLEDKPMTSAEEQEDISNEPSSVICNASSLPLNHEEKSTSLDTLPPATTSDQSGMIL